MATEMTEIRVVGRGGQGAVTFATLLAKAAGNDGKHVQAFGAYGPERRGAPVKAFCRISDRPIHVRSQIYNPDYVVVLDPSLASLDDTLGGLKNNSVIIINSRDKHELGLKQKSQKQRVCAFDATSLALEVMGKDIVNTAMLGAFARISGLVDADSVLKALGEVFDSRVLELNKKLVKDAYKKAEECAHG